MRIVRRPRFLTDDHFLKSNAAFTRAHRVFEALSCIWFSPFSSPKINETVQGQMWTSFFNPALIPCPLLEEGARFEPCTYDASVCDESWACGNCGLYGSITGDSWTVWFSKGMSSGFAVTGMAVFISLATINGRI